MKFTTHAVALLLAFASASAVLAQEKPVVLIAGEGNVKIDSNGGATFIGDFALGGSSTSVSKHDQTMEMAQDLVKFCPGVTVTLDRGQSPDYYVALDREAMGKSQVMVLNRKKIVVSVMKQPSVARSIKSACVAMAADWQANGRLAASAAAPTSLATPVPAMAPTGPQTRPAKVALVLEATARATKYCKPETISSVHSDVLAYLNSKGVAVGSTQDSAYTLLMTVDRPPSKWLVITLQTKSTAGILWSKTISNGSWVKTGTGAMLKVLDVVHATIDANLGEKNGLPLLARP